MAETYSDQVARLEAEYANLYDKIERHGGVDYRGELPAMRKRIAELKRNSEKFTKLRQAVESTNPREVGRIVVETILDADEDVQEIAADFIENEVGRLDWVNNWEVVKSKEDPVAKVQRFLSAYGLTANAAEIVSVIDSMTKENPGRWK